MGNFSFQQTLDWSVVSQLNQNIYTDVFSSAVLAYP